MSGVVGEGSRTEEYAGIMSPKQQRFVEEYLIDLNATAAAKRAGYSERTAQEQSSRLLSNVMVQQAIQAAQESRSKRTEIKADAVLAELAKIAFSDMRTFAEWGPGGVKLKPSEELAPDQSACVAEVSESTSKDGGSLRFKLHSKTEALSLLGKHLKLFTDRLEVAGAIRLELIEEIVDAPQPNEVDTASSGPAELSSV